ncbi:MAG TPA: 2-phospho-L-lactate transferase [Terriglobales bacterium]|nr:2-phospho-L-lactate transferase [Terriglobales bacterium]
MYVALAGGVGAARFLEGLVRVVPQKKITIVGNVGDDTEFYGLHVSPDLDIVTYTLAGLVDTAKGWGFRDDTFQCQQLLQTYGYRPWFNLGDRDLATHLFRTELLHKGKSLSNVTASIVSRLSLHVTLLPASDDQMQTHVVTRSGQMHFQEYMVKRKTHPQVSRVVFKGAKEARPAPNVIKSILNAEGVIVCPSNPIVSIGAILAVKGIRSALRKTKARVVAVSPIIAGKTVKGPADKLMKSMNVEASAFGVAYYYKDFLDTLIIDNEDRGLASRIQAIGIKPIAAQTLMKTVSDKIRLARLAVSEVHN